jgi:pantoate--beta-alanine ligase
LIFILILILILNFTDPAIRQPVEMAFPYLCTQNITHMHVFKTVDEIQGYLGKQHGATIGFVPTMGALHDGHLSLVVRSRDRCDMTVVSIFVNPKQFNDPDDLLKYPRTPDEDMKLLRQEGCDFIFMPEVEDIYPPGREEEPIDLAGLDLRMEGMFRPGHFAGVAQVVRRLLEIVQPGFLYMGQKDFQQVAIVRHMIKSLELPVYLVMCPTVREENGLAMSSRNERLTAGQRADAAVIYRTLMHAADCFGASTVDKLQHECFEMLAIPGFRPEYFEIVDGHTLLPAHNDTNFAVACCALWAGEVRLIDNMVLRDV